MKPKNIRILTLCAAAVALTLGNPLGAQEKEQEHAEHAEHGKIAGPNGGRVITSIEPHLEFLVTDERKVEIRVVNEAGEVQPLGGQEATLIGGDRSNPTRLSFARSGEALVSDQSLPEGNDIPVILRIKPGPEAEFVTERISLNLNDCPGCDYLEYACTCEHAGEEDHGH